MKTFIFSVALLAGVFLLLPVEADAQYHGVTRHRLSRRASRVHRPGWQDNHGQRQVPELDPRAAGSSLVLLLGGVAVLRRGRRGSAGMVA